LARRKAMFKKDRDNYEKEKIKWLKAVALKKLNVINILKGKKKKGKP